MEKSIVQLVLTIRNPVAFVKNYVRIHPPYCQHHISQYFQIVGFTMMCDK